MEEQQMKYKADGVSIQCSGGLYNAFAEAKARAFSSHTIDTPPDIGWLEDLVKAERSNIYGIDPPVLGTNKGSRRKPNKDNKLLLTKALKTFKDLEDKCIGDNLLLGGSVALFLQGKIDRTIFKDLDVIISGNLELDDDMEDNTDVSFTEDNAGSYSGVRGVIFNDVVVDIFMATEKSPATAIDVEYEGVTYKCNHYKDILAAKVYYMTSNMKDYDCLIANGTLDISIR